MDDQAYLEPHFDPSTLTVPRLRSILVAHNINYPSSAKKPQLIELFNQNVAAKARKILSDSARVKRTSRGIEDVTSGRRGTGAGDGDGDEELLAPSRTSRRSTRARTEEATEEESVPRSSRRTAPPEPTPRRSSSKHARTAPAIREEDEIEPAPKRSAMRQSRVGAATAYTNVAAENDDSHFSNDNVFQSGGSPPRHRAPEPDRRRTTLGSATNAARDLEKRNRELRRRTEEVRPIRPQADNAIVLTRKTFDYPVSRVKKQEIEPTEEFTPEGELEIAEAKSAGELVPARRRTKQTAGAPQAVGVIFFALMMGLAAMWSQEKFNVGYCGLGTPSRQVAGVEIPEWAQTIRPECAPCPAHAYCHDRLLTECESGFVVQNHPLSLGGLLPIPPSCEPDSAKARKVNAVKQRAVEELREANAKHVCGEAAKPEIREAELKESISSKRRKGMSNEEFEDLWASAIPEIENVDDVTSGSDGTGHAILRSTSHAAVPLSCAVRRSLRETLRRYFWHAVSVFLVLASGSYGRYTITSGRETETRAKQLAGLALEKLSLQAALHVQEPEVYGENYVSVAQLRDDVLRDEFSAARRNKLWAKVQRKVEGNANVRPMVREGRTGDVGRVWEWVGAVGMLESPPLGGERRRTGRLSYSGQDRMIEESSFASKSEIGERTKWQENRSYF